MTDHALRTEYELLKRFARDTWILQNHAEYAVVEYRRAIHDHRLIRARVFQIITDHGTVPLTSHLEGENP